MSPWMNSVYLWSRPCRWSQRLDAATNTIFPCRIAGFTLGSHVFVTATAASISLGFEIGRALVEMYDRCRILVLRFSCDVQDKCESAPNYENLVEFLR